MVEAQTASEGELNTSEVLLTCIKDGRIDVLRAVLAQLAKAANFAAQVDSICCEQGTLLHYAVYLESVDAVRTLLSSGVNPCIQNDEGKRAIQLASENEAIRSAFVQELLQATAHSNLGRVCQMLSSGVDINSVDSPSTMNTALHWAASFGNDDIVRTLCESGADVSAVNAKGDTPLHESISRGCESIAKILLQHGADTSIKNSNSLNAFDLAEKKESPILHILSADSITQKIRRATSVDSIEFDRSSVISVADTSALFGNSAEKVSSTPIFTDKLDSWTDLLWPQPQYLEFESEASCWIFPKDNRLKVYFDGASEGEPRRMMQSIQISTPLLSGTDLDLEYRGHQVAESHLDGQIVCGVFEDDDRPGGYTLTIRPVGIELFASDYSGIRYGFATLVQILRIHKSLINRQKIALEKAEGVTNGEISELRNLVQPGRIQSLVIRDFPDMNIRALYQDFSGCKILNSETLLQLATRLSYCKANYLFVNFEVRTTDRYQLCYTNRERFHMNQVCEELFVKMVPSLDLQTNYIEPFAARQILDNFLDDFPLSKIAHFGPNLSSILINNRPMLNSIQRRVSRIFLSVDVDETNAHLIATLPCYVTLCVEGKYPFEEAKHLSPRLNVVLKFSATDTGYLCSSPESTTRKSVLAGKLGAKLHLAGIAMCDLSTGCEIMPHSLSYMAEVASVGVAWNRSVDMRRFSYLLPKIAAEHVLLDGQMTALFEQIATIGRVEHELTKYNCSPKKTSSSSLTDERKISLAPPPISVYVEMILNPEHMMLDRMTPTVFKKARIELRKCLKALDEARKQLPYNFELALVLAEIQLVTELMVLISKLGQFLCMHVANGGNGEQSSLFTASQAGVVHLPMTVRTDLANSLLAIRTKFQHTWLSRNIASTLPNALKIFDNLFRALLPPSMQDLGKQLL
ncbi:hypothetical protein QR680_005270 [Steinernema hermaphroditum]|uniref:ANK_REP_REGION domain-containing protein n=1 Tax=Steinernema hermaphroditum TaxID=289476 RepID=A0AA39HTQ0_9BILA|nr:hypothetical protein QR680_005270 [Steinernema hermaphroditum]